MTSLKLSYRRGVPAAMLLGLIVVAPDIAQAVQLRGGSYPAIPTRGPSIPFIPRRGPSLVPFGTPPQPVPKTPPSAFAPSYKPGPGARGGGRGGGGIDLRQAGDDGDATGL